MGLVTPDVLVPHSADICADVVERQQIVTQCVVERPHQIADELRRCPLVDTGIEQQIPDAFVRAQVVRHTGALRVHPGVECRDKLPDTIQFGIQRHTPAESDRSSLP